MSDATERPVLRSGIEGPRGTALALPGFYPTFHEHLCTLHEPHWWQCLIRTCVQHEATPCIRIGAGR